MFIGSRPPSSPMRRMITFWIMLAVLSIYPFSAYPVPRVLADRSDSVKIVVDARDTVTLADVQQRGATLLVDYGSFSLWRVPRASADAALVDASIVPVDEFDTIYLRDGDIDTRAAQTTTVAPSLRQQRIEGSQLWMVQFVGPVKQAWLDDLRASGLVPVIYMPNHAYIIRGNGERLQELEQRVTSSTFLQWTGAYHPAYRLAPGLQQLLGQADAPDLVDVTVQFVTTATTRQSLQRLQALGGTVYMQPVQIGAFTSISLQVPVDQLEALAHWDDIFNIEAWYAPELLDERQAQIVAGNLRGNEPDGPGYLEWLAQYDFPTTADAYPLVAVVDTGLDTGSVENPGHPSLREAGDPEGSSRIAAIVNCTSDSLGDDYGGHGTLNAGIVGGYTNATSPIDRDSDGYLLAQGISPYGQLIGSKVFDNSGWFDIARCQSSYVGIVEANYAAGATITSNSWGNSYYASEYTFAAQSYDALTRDGAAGQPGDQEMLHIFAAGNSGPYTFAISSPATAKNVLSVGATENVRDNAIADGCGVTDADNSSDIASFSSRGPTWDKRIKPDLVAPGTHIQGPASQSTGYNGYDVCGSDPVGDDDDARYYPQDQTLYTISSGTSHSTPAVAGAAALLSEYYTRVWSPGQTPSPAMLKALLLNQPRYLAGRGANDTLPSVSQGWGAAQLRSLLETEHMSLIDQDSILSQTGQVFEVNGTVAEADTPVAISLVWTDAPGSTTGAAYVNDLNLEITVNGTVYKGNVFAGAQSQTGGSFDTRNNVERIFLPAGLTGPISIRVIAANLTGDGIPGNAYSTDQDFAVVAANVTDVARVTAADITWSDAFGNGNGIIDRGEPITLQVTLENRGTQSLTGISSELVVTNGSARMIQAYSAYADLPTTGSSAVNSTTYVLRVSPELACEDAILIQQHVRTSSGQEFVLDLSFEAGVALSANRYVSQNPEREIPDDDYWGGLRSDIMVPDTGTVVDVNVQVTIRHPWVGDLALILAAPDDEYIYLVSRPRSGAENGDDFRDTIFDDEGSNGSIRDASPPYTGSFVPLEPLSVFDGHAMNGSWSLYVYDEVAEDVGVLESWSLDIQPHGRACVAYNQVSYLPIVVSPGP